MADTGSLVICSYSQPIRYQQDFHVEFDFFLSDPGESYTAMTLDGTGDLSLVFGTSTATLTGTVSGSTYINELYDISNPWGAFNKVKLTFLYTATTVGTNVNYDVTFTFNNTVITRTVTITSDQANLLFAEPMLVKFNGFSGTQLKNIVFNEVSCTTLGAQAIQILVFDSDDSTSLIYDHSGNDNDVTDTNNSEIILKDA